MYSSFFNILICKTFSHETWSTNRYVCGQYFQEIFAIFGGMSPKSRPESNLLKLTQETNYDEFVVYSLLKVCTEKTENNVHHLLKCN